MGDLTADEKAHVSDSITLLERCYQLRDRIAYSVFLQKDLGLKWLVGSSFALCVFMMSFGLDISRPAGAAPGWRMNFPSPPFLGFFFAVAATVLGFMRPFWGIIAAIVAFEILFIIYSPGLFLIGTSMVVGSFLVWFFVRPNRGALAALLSVPILESYLGLGALAPLGLACFYPWGKAFWMTLTIFAWSYGIGLWRGTLPRIGFEGPGFYSQGEVLSLTVIKGPPWSTEIIQANLRRLGKLEEWLVGKEDLLTPFLIDLCLMAVVLWIVRTRHRPVGYKDRLAIEYLSRESGVAPKENISPFKQPIGIVLGLTLWIAVQSALTLIIPGFYGPSMIACDILAGVLVILAVFFDYHGDPNLPLEFAHETNRPQPKVKETSSSLASSTFRVPTPSEMKLEYPSKPGPSVRQKDPSHLRLTSWRDRVKEDWHSERNPGGATRSPNTSNDPTPPLPISANRNSFEIGGMIDDQYRIEQVLNGGMGIVYIVSDDFSGVRYAVKTLKDDLRANQEAVARFSSEAKTWIRLGHHPHIVQAMFYRVIQSRALLFLEYVDGTDLEEVYGRPGPPPSLKQLIQWGIQFCDGMEFASTKDLGNGVTGLVHRDIKPGNIMLTKEGVIKITDFGLAKVADAPTNLTREKVGLGTLKYMAPEQVKDAKHVDLRADIYSFGAVLYEGLTGRPPFVEENSIDLYMAVLSKNPERVRTLLPGIPDELDRMIMRCLQKDKDLRYSSFDELGWALRRFDDHLSSGESTSHLRVVS